MQNSGQVIPDNRQSGGLWSSSLLPIATSGHCLLDLRSCAVNIQHFLPLAVARWKVERLEPKGNQEAALTPLLSRKVQVLSQLPSAFLVFTCNMPRDQPRADKPTLTEADGATRGDSNQPTDGDPGGANGEDQEWEIVTGVEAVNEPCRRSIREFKFRVGCGRWRYNVFERQVWAEEDPRRR